jgi:hypothetical protein
MIEALVVPSKGYRRVYHTLSIARLEVCARKTVDSVHHKDQALPDTTDNTL